MQDERPGRDNRRCQCMRAAATNQRRTSALLQFALEQLVGKLRIRLATALLHHLRRRESRSPLVLPERCMLNAWRRWPRSRASRSAAARPRRCSVRVLPRHTISSADRPESYIFAKTSFAIELLIVPLSIERDESCERRRRQRHLLDRRAALLHRPQQLAHHPVARGFRRWRSPPRLLEIIGETR